MSQFLIVCLGGGLGAGLRYLSMLLALRWLGPGYPFGTIIVNVSGSLLMGILIAMLGRKFGDVSELRLFLATGFLGGFTTFSAFSLDVAVLWERGATGAMLAYIVASVALSIAAIFVGFWLVRSIT